MQQFKTKTFVTDEERLNAFKDGNGFIYTADGRKLIGYEGTETKISIKDGVEVIGDKAFAGTNIETIKMSNSVVLLGAYAFQDCLNLWSVILSDAITHIGEGAFFLCERLGRLGTNSTYDYAEAYFFILPAGIKQILDFTFYNCNSLDNPIFPKELIRIGKRAFSFSRVIKLSVPSSVIEIGDEAFCGCDWLTELHLPISILSMGKDVLKDCPALKRVTIDKGSRLRMRELLPDFEHLFVEE